jgi:hypothetical protein
MAQRKISIELEANTNKASSEIEDLKKEINRLNDEVAKGNKQTEKGLKGVEKASQKTAKGVSAIGNSLKAAGIGLAIAAFAKLTEVFNQNQKVTNLFNTTFEALSLAFNDFFGFLNDNIGTVVGYFKSIFSDPKQALIDFVNSIKTNLTERLNSLIETFGYLASAVKKVFEGDFAGALDSVKQAGKESLDVLTGVNDTFDKASEVLPNVVKGIADYAKSTIKAAKDTVELNRAAEIGIAQNRIILEQKDREAEKLRQIRDDESKTIQERIEANNKLAEVLNEQERLMLANADAVIAAAQAQYNKNKNDENQIALLDARAEKEGILAQIEGFRSEQLTNINSLERERLDLKEEEKEKEIELAELKEQLRVQELQGMLSNIDTLRAVIGEETALSKALFIARQALLVKEQIAEAKATLSRITMRSAEASVDLAKGTASTAKVGFPQNIPLLIAFAAQAAGIFAAIKSAVGAAKSSTSSFGGGGSGVGASSPSAPQAPAFNVVGAAPENQLAETIGNRENKPVKAFVVSQEVSTQQALDRNIESSASIG